MCTNEKPTRIQNHIHTLLLKNDERWKSTRFDRRSQTKLSQLMKNQLYFNRRRDRFDERVFLSYQENGYEKKRKEKLTDSAHNKPSISIYSANIV